MRPSIKHVHKILPFLAPLSMSTFDITPPPLCSCFMDDPYDKLYYDTFWQSIVFVIVCILVLLTALAETCII